MSLKYGPTVIDDTRQEPDSESPFWSANDIGIAQHYGVPTRFRISTKDVSKTASRASTADNNGKG